MNILYLIGNGFDLNAGLNTSAKTIIEKYKMRIDSIIDEEVSPDECYTLLRRSINQKGIDTWADFEMALGDFTYEVEGCEDPILVFRNAYEDFIRFFGEVISNENEIVDKLVIDDSVLDRFHAGVRSCCDDGMRPASQSNLRGVLNIAEGWDISFITFNYTTLLDRLVNALNKRGGTTIRYGNSTYARAYNVPLHVHGTLSDDHGLIIGVDDKSQIAGETCCKSEIIQRILIKPEQNRRAEDLRQTQAFQLIDKADVICVYGMSLGETDCTWWRKLGEWVSNQNAPARRLILSKPKPDISPYMSYAIPDAMDKQKRLFLARSGIEGSANKLKSGNNEKLLVSFGTRAFDLFVQS